MLSAESQITLQGSISPPSSGSETKPSAVSSMGQTTYYVKLVENDRFFIRYRPLLSSERMPHSDDIITVKTMAILS
jgi:hypothetical protein